MRLFHFPGNGNASIVWKEIKLFHIYEMHLAWPWSQANLDLKCCLTFFFFNVYLFREREEVRESQAGYALSAQSPMWGSIPQTVRSWPEPKSKVGCLTDWATQAPLSFYLFWERERDRVKEVQTERYRESQASPTLSAQSPTWGSNPQTARSWPEPKLRVRGFTDGATQVPHPIF